MMLNKTFNFVILSLILLLVNSCNKKNASSELIGTFGYISYETDGQNLYVEINNKIYPIFWSKKSNPKYLNALHSLRSEILCYNSSGRSIYLEGTYFAENNEFILKRWYIETPFYCIDNYILGQDQIYILKDSLTLADFTKAIEVPLNDLVLERDKFIYEKTKDLSIKNKRMGRNNNNSR